MSELDQGGVWQEAAALLQSIAGVNSTESNQATSADAALPVLGPLAQTRAALEESAATRAVLDKLLADQSALLLEN